jgi:hypothetical protein
MCGLSKGRGGFFWKKLAMGSTLTLWMSALILACFFAGTRLKSKTFTAATLLDVDFGVHLYTTANAPVPNLGPS